MNRHRSLNALDEVLVKLTRHYVAVVLSGIAVIVSSALRGAVHAGLGSSDPADASSHSTPRTPLRLALMVAALATGTVACGSGGQESTGVAGDSLIARGAEIYEQSCASCHGADLRGTDKGPSHLSIVYEPNHHSDDSFRSAIANGAPQHHWPFGDMPPVEGLTDDDVEAVIVFIRAEQQRQGFEQ